MSRRPIFSRARAALGLVALAWAAAVQAAPSAMSEDELSASEKSNRIIVPADIGQMQARDYRVQLALAFSAASAPAGTEPADVATASPAVKAVDNVTSAHAAAIGFKDLNHNATNSRLVTISMLLSIIDAFKTKRPNDRAALTASWNHLRHDSFVLVRIARHDDSRSMTDSIDGAFTQGRSMLEALDLGCSPSQVMIEPQDGKAAAQGEYIAGVMHFRSYVCGHRSPIDAVTANGERVTLLAQTVGAGAGDYSMGVFARIDMSGIAIKEGLRHALDEHDAMPFGTHGRALFERIKASMPAGWVAIFSEPSQTHQQRITMGDRDRELSLDLDGEPATARMKID